MKILLKAVVTALVIIFAVGPVFSNSPIGDLDSELTHDDSRTSFHAASFQLIADECFNYFAAKGIQLNSFWWNVRIVQGTEIPEWRVILTSVNDQPRWRMCRVVMDYPENVDSNYTVTEVID